MIGTQGERWPQAETTVKVIYNLHWAKNRLEMRIF